MATKKNSTPVKRNLKQMGALRLADADAWEKHVREAMRDAAGRVSDAAKALGVSRNTLFNWLREKRFADIERAPTGVHRND